MSSAAIPSPWMHLKNYLIKYNNVDCCPVKPVDSMPYADEVVVHIRNFAGHLEKKGFREMKPYQMAYELMEPYHGNKSQPIGIVSKDPVLNYIAALRTVGFTKIRHVQHQHPGPANPMYDFCFMMHTQHHLVGMRKSTFFTWAGRLSNASIIRSYTMAGKEYIRAKSRPLLGFSQEQWQYETYGDNFIIPKTANRTSRKGRTDQNSRSKNKKNKRPNKNKNHDK
jgi:hypothetical protein